MKFRLVFVLLFISTLLPKVADCQLALKSGRTILVYAEYNELAPANEVFLLPYIESILDSLKINDTLLFSDVVNLNRLLSNSLLNTKNLYDRFKGKGREAVIDDIARQSDSSLAERIRNASGLINIQTVKVQNHIEFQVYYLEIPKGKDGKFLSFPNTVPTNEIRFTSTVINLDKDDYRNKLSILIRKIFPKSNIPPVAKIEVNARQTPEGYYHFSKGDSITIDASSSFDEDTPYEELVFNWRQLSESNRELAASESFAFDRNKPKISFKAKNSGTYSFLISIDDGVTATKHYLKLRVENPIEVAASQSSFYYLRSINIFNLSSFLSRDYQEIDDSIVVLVHPSDNNRPVHLFATPSKKDLDGPFRSYLWASIDANDIDVIFRNGWSSYEEWQSNKWVKIAEKYFVDNYASNSMVDSIIARYFLYSILDIRGAIRDTSYARVKYGSILNNLEFSRRWSNKESTFPFKFDSVYYGFLGNISCNLSNGHHSYHLYAFDEYLLSQKETIDITLDSKGPFIINVSPYAILYSTYGEKKIPHKLISGIKTTMTFCLLNWLNVEIGSIDAIHPSETNNTRFGDSARYYAISIGKADEQLKASIVRDLYSQNNVNQLLFGLNYDRQFNIFGWLKLNSSLGLHFSTKETWGISGEVGISFDIFNLFLTISSDEDNRPKAKITN